MAERFTLYAFNPLSGTRLGEMPFTRVQATIGLAGRASLDVTGPWWDRRLDPDVLLPGRIGLVLDDGGLVRASGWLQTVEVSVDGGVRLGCVSWWEYYRHRWIRSRAGMTFATGTGPYDVEFSGVDQFEVVSDLIAHAASVAGAANLGLTVSMHGPGSGGIAGVSRTVTYYGYERKRIADAVEDLASQQDGFDFTVGVAWDMSSSPPGVTRTLDLWYPRKGAALVGTLEHSTNVRLLRLVRDGARMANPVVAVGAGTGDAQVTATVEDAAYRYPAGPYPFLEGEVFFRDVGVEDTANLTRLANAELAVSREPLDVATLEMQEVAGMSLGSIAPGDSVRVIADIGALSLDKTMRITREELVVTPTTLEQWTVECASEDASLGVL